MDEYEFAFRGLLTEEALDRAGRSLKRVPGLFDTEIAEKLSIDLLDEEFVVPAKQMAAVYVAVAAFENAARELVTNVLVDAVDENWWDGCVSDRIRSRCTSRQAEEEKNRYHTQRGEAPINYSELNDLLNIIKQNWEHFEAFLPTQEWTASIFAPIERSRNVIMHSGTLGLEDIERVGINLRDWVKQVGT